MACAPAGRAGAGSGVQLVALHRSRHAGVLPAGRRRPPDPRVADHANGSALHRRPQRVKRVLHLGKFYPPVTGGMERVLQTLCLVSAGLVESQVLVTHTGREDLHEEVAIGGTDGLPAAIVDVTRVGTLARHGSVNVAPGFVAALRRSRADLIVLHEPNPWALLSYAIARPPAPLAIWYHSDVVRPALQYALFYAPLARLAYNRAERIVVSSPALAEQARTLAPVPRSRVCDSVRDQPE